MDDEERQELRDRIAKLERRARDLREYFAGVVRALPNGEYVLALSSDVLGEGEEAK